MIQKLAEIERELILAAVKEAGSPMKAAPLLGIGKTTLYRRLHAWGWTGTGTKPEPQPTQPKPIQMLRIPSTQIETQSANLRCPGCRTIVLLPEVDSQ